MDRAGTRRHHISLINQPVSEMTIIFGVHYDELQKQYGYLRVLYNKRYRGCFDG
jgi:hypothetical protein